MSTAGRRRGSDTKAEILDVALELFTEKGFEGASLREIAERLGITKAALYYHFSSKEDIVRTVVEENLAAFDELVAWAQAQPRGPELRERVLSRWADMIGSRGLRTVRFLAANQHALRGMASVRDAVNSRARQLFAALVDPDAPVREQLRVRVALFSVSVTAMVAADLDVDDAVVLATALEIGHELMPGLPEPSTCPMPRATAAG